MESMKKMRGEVINEALYPPQTMVMANSKVPRNRPT